MPPKPKKRPVKAPVKPPKRKWLRRQQQLTGSNPADASSLTLPQLKALPAEVLRLYLSSRNLVTTGNITAMASWLHSALHQQQSDPSPSASVTSQTAAPPLVQLQQSVGDMVDESLQALQGRLLESIQATLQKPSGAPANPTPMPTSPDSPEPNIENSGTDQQNQDNISLPSVNHSPTNPQPGESVVVSGVEPARPVPLPAVPAKLKQCIIKGEYVEFDQLLPESMFPTRYNTNIPPSFTLSLSPDPSPVGDNILISQPRVANKRTVTDLPSWLEAWNVYVAINVAHYPARASALFTYQRVICNASSKFSPQAWLKYDSRFRSLAAADRSLRWDQKVNDLWLECFTLPPPSTSNPSPANAAATVITPPSTAKPTLRTRHPCTYCGVLNHLVPNNLQVLKHY